MSVKSAGVSFLAASHSRAALSATVIALDICLRALWSLLRNVLFDIFQHMNVLETGDSEYVFGQAVSS